MKECQLWSTIYIDYREVLYYRSLVKKVIILERVPTPYFWPNRVKVYLDEHPPRYT